LHSQDGRFGADIRLLLPGIKPRFFSRSALSLVTIQTKLSRLVYSSVRVTLNKVTSLRMALGACSL